MRRLKIDPPKHIGEIAFNTNINGIKEKLQPILGEPIKQATSKEFPDYSYILFKGAIFIFYRFKFVEAIIFLSTKPDKDAINIIMGMTNVNTHSMDALKKDMRMKSDTDETRGIRLKQTGKGDTFEIYLTDPRARVDSKFETAIVNKYHSKVDKTTDKKTVPSKPSKEKGNKESKPEPKKPNWMNKKEAEKAKKSNAPKNKKAAVPIDAIKVKKESADEPIDLMKYYDELKTKVNSDPGAMTPTSTVPPTALHGFTNKLHDQSERLKDRCCKHIILDIYLRTNPVGDSYCNKHHHELEKDVDNMLTAKNMSPTEYITSSYEKTEAPLLGYILRSIDNICSTYVEESLDQFKRAEENNINMPPPDEPNPETNEDLNKQLVDTKNDIEYNSFINTLKKKTQNKIVNEISNLILDKKQQDEMKFDPKEDESLKAQADQQMQNNQNNNQQNNNDQNNQNNSNNNNQQNESAISVCMDYISNYVMGNNYTVENTMNDDFLALCIRDCALNEMNKCFKQEKVHNFSEFASNIKYGNGLVLNEIALYNLMN